jgi:cholesterol transport system auxiliary component
MRRLLSLILLSIALSGCLTAGKRGGDSAMAVYDLGPPGEPPGARRSVPIALDVQAPLWLDSENILYRLAYQEPARLREYTLARWAGPVPQLLRQGLQKKLDFVALGQLPAPCLLRVELQEFTQVFAAPDNSKAVLQARLYWLDARRAPLASRDISLEVAAPTADARGGVAGFFTLFGQLTAGIRDWEAELARSGKLAACTH